MLKESVKICLIISLLLPFIGCQEDDDSKFNLITFASIVGKYKGSSTVCTILPNIQDTICTSAADNTLNIIILDNQTIVISDVSGIYGKDTIPYIQKDVINDGNRFLFSKANINLVYQENDRQITYEDKSIDANTEILNIFTGKK
jgi:hypothetical protein